MKKINLIILLFLSTSYLTGQTIKDGNNHLIASIDINGTLTDMNGDTIGHFLTNGNVEDMNNDMLGKCDLSGNYISADNDTIGSIDETGIIKDYSNTMIGKIDSNGDILDVNDDKIGWCSNIATRNYVAGYFFFFFRDI